MTLAVGMGTLACSGGHTPAPSCTPAKESAACLAPDPVTHLFFAVVGDTRPANEDQTSTYPTPVIQQIYADIEAMKPRPQFVLSTGDYMFANPLGAQGQPQLNLYMQAAAQFSGPLYPVMGNHECSGLTNSNCVGGTTNNFTAYLSTMVTPLGLTEPYYTVNFKATDASWTAKLVVIACNAWSSTQLSWLQSQLAVATTYTIIARHEEIGAGSSPPCLPDVDPILQGSQYPYDVLVVGHSHQFGTLAKQVIVGNGGAPLNSGSIYGYATIQEAGGSFTVTQYDSSTAAPVGQPYTFPH